MTIDLSSTYKSIAATLSASARSSAAVHPLPNLATDLARNIAAITSTHRSILAASQTLQNAARVYPSSLPTGLDMSGILDSIRQRGTSSG